jgi:hypothetical protein
MGMMQGPYCALLLSHRYGLLVITIVMIQDLCVLLLLLGFGCSFFSERRQPMNSREISLNKYIKAI